MAENVRGISIDLVIHPGETISDILEARNLTQKELAKRAGVSEAFLNDVIHGKKDISKGLARGLEYALGVPSSFWLKLQANYDAELLSLNEENSVEAEELQILKELKEIEAYLKNNRSIISEPTKELRIIQLRKILKVSTLTGLKSLVPAGAFRLSKKASINPYVFGAWLCMCKEQNETNTVENQFSLSNVPELCVELKEFMCNCKGDFQNSLSQLFARYGIQFSVMRNFKGAPVQGYISRGDNGTYQIVVTLRGARADIFWFSLFHELGHIVNGDLAKPGSFIVVDEETDARKEHAADKFARDVLLDPDDYNAFVNKQVFTFHTISEFAATQNVPSYIVVGRLMREEYIQYRYFAKYIPRYKWIDKK